jgi:hypothetical protein
MEFFPSATDLDVAGGEKAYTKAAGELMASMGKYTIADALTDAERSAFMGPKIKAYTEAAGFTPDQTLMALWETQKLSLEQDNKIVLPDATQLAAGIGRLNPMVLCLAAMPGDAGNFQMRACIADPDAYRTKALEFYEKTWDGYKPALYEKELPCLALWDLFCTATIAGAAEAAQHVAKVSYMLKKGSGFDLTPRPDLFTALFQPINDVLKRHKGVPLIIGCQEMPDKNADGSTDELEAAATKLSVGVKIYRKEVESGTISGFIYSDSLHSSFADKTDLVAKDLNDYLAANPKVDSKVKDTTLRKLVLGQFTLPSGPDGAATNIGVLVFHCKSFKNDTDIQAEFVAHALDLAKKALKCEVYVVGDMNLTAKWPKGMSAAEQYKLVKGAERFQMPKEITALTEKFDDVLKAKAIKTYPVGPVLTTLKMRTKFQAQAEKEGELSAVHKDFVILPAAVDVKETICGGRVKKISNNLDLLQPSRLWPCDHFTIMVVV